METSIYSTYVKLDLNNAFGLDTAFGGFVKQILHMIGLFNKYYKNILWIKEIRSTINVRTVLVQNKIKYISTK